VRQHLRPRRGPAAGEAPDDLAVDAEDDDVELVVELCEQVPEARLRSPNNVESE